MGHLNNIIQNVKEKGSHEEHQAAILNAIFRGEDSFEQTKAWAKSVGLTVFRDDHHCTYIFRAIQDSATQVQLSQQ